MVMISRLFFALPALFSVALADLRVINPGANLWWVAQSENVLAWTCEDSSIEKFTVLVANKNELAAPLALIAIQNNFDCSRIITQDQSNLPVGSGYTILLANPLNNSEVYATSEEFEIKPLGSAYPTSLE